MIREKDKLIKDLIIENFVFYNDQISEVRVRIFAAELADLEVEDIARAFAEYRREKGRRLMPMPSDIRSKIQPGDCSHRALAVEAAARILTAIKNYDGNTQKSKDYIGELGWSVVRVQGGMDELSRSVTNDNIQICQAQWRDIAMAHLEMGYRQEAGVKHISDNRVGELNSLADTLNGVLPQNGDVE